MPNLVLIGYRGTGKTTVARLLAERLGREWFDADARIEQRAGKSIEQIFAEEGEARFREWEREVVAELALCSDAVLSLGGGAVLSEANRRALAEAVAVWLTADAATIEARLAADPSTGQRRPRLTTAGGRAEIDRLLRQREPIYRDCADYTVDTVQRTPEQVAQEIVSLVRADL